MICASEQAVIVDEEIAEEFERTMKKYGCYFLKEEEIEPLTKYVINLDKMAGERSHRRKVRLRNCDGSRN
jgi:acetaldehyde dehydrogenase/alcohol dehydrogenase